MDKTYVPESRERWYLMNASGQTLGRLASKIAEILVGKHRPISRGVVLGDHVVVIRLCEKIPLLMNDMQKIVSTTYWLSKWS